MVTNIYRNGFVHIVSRMCDTCIFRPDIELTHGRRDAMVREATRNESAIICHSTLDKSDQDACYGFFKQHPTATLQVAERLKRITFTEPQHV